MRCGGDGGGDGGGGGGGGGGGKDNYDYHGGWFDCTVSNGNAGNDEIDNTGFSDATAADNR